ERLSPPVLRLAVTVACEHFTAILAEEALADGALDLADEPLRHLLAWHAVEELEHKAVAFDVLQRVAPSYALRMAGLALATAMLGGFWFAASRELLRQDGLSVIGAARELRSLRSALTAGARMPPSVLRHVFLGGICEYLRPTFHP